MAEKSILSGRATELIRALDTPWRFAPRGNYDPDENPEGLITFATAENTLVHDDLVEFTRNNVTISHRLFTYQYSTAGGPRLPLLLARHLNEYFKPSRPLDGSEIRVTGSATAMHELLGWAVGDAGDAILSSSPVYGRLELDFGNKAGLRMVYADDTDARNAFEPGVTDRFERALAKSRASGIRVRALLIVNPNNPVGRCYPRDTLAALMRFCQRERLHLISDEIYGTSVFRDEDAEDAEDDQGRRHLPGFTSALSVVGPDRVPLLDDDLLHVTYGLSKDFSAPGLRLGCVVTRSTAVRELINATMRFHNPSGPSVAIASAMLEDRAWCGAFLARSRGKIAEAYAFVTTGLSRLGIEYMPANAGFFVLINLRPFLRRLGQDNETGAETETKTETGTGGEEAFDAEFDLARRLLDGGVFLHPKEEHGEVGWFRMVYTQDRRVVAEGLRRMKLVLDIREPGDDGTVSIEAQAMAKR